MTPADPLQGLVPRNPGSRGLSRRTLLSGALAGAGLLGAGALSGCGNPFAQTTDGTLIRFWNLLAGGDGVLLQELLDIVRAEMPAADIRNVTLAWGAPYYTKLAMASAGGRAPELAILHMARLPGYAPGGLLDPWDANLLAEHGVTQDMFTPAVWGRTQYQDQTYAIPLDTHPFVLFYNTDIAGQAGLLGPDGLLVEITTPEQFIEAGRAMQQVTGEYGLSYGTRNDVAQAWRGFFTFYSQTGAELDLSGTEVQLDRGAAVRVVEFLQAVFDGTVANPNDDIDAGIAAFVAGRTGMLFSGDWEVPTMQEAGLPFDVAPIPTMFGQPAAYADSHSFVLPTQLAVDPERRRATHEFVGRMLQNSLLWAEAGHIPAYQPVVRSAEYQQLVPQTHYAEVADYVIFDPPAWFTGSGSNFSNRISQILQSAIIEGVGAEETVDQMVDEMNTFLATPNPA
jgi:multiple sugar transport system substrate-binding protein